MLDMMKNMKPYFYTIDYGNMMTYIKMDYEFHIFKQHAFNRAQGRRLNKVVRDGVIHVVGRH
jgi:hypothetical protein